MNNLINLNSDSTREDCILWLKQRYNIDLYIDKQQRMKEFNSIIEAFLILSNRSRRFDNKNGPKQIIYMSKWLIDYYEKNHLN